MATVDDDTATVTIAFTELKPPNIAWSVKDVHKEFTMF